MGNTVEIEFRGRDSTGAAVNSAIQNTERLGRQVKQLSGAVNAATNVLTVFGNNTLQNVAMQASMVGTTISSVSQAMKGMSAVKMAQWGAIGAGVGLAAYGVNQYIESLERQKAATESAIKVQDDLEMGLAAYGSEVKRAELNEQRRFRQVENTILALREQGAEVQTLESLNRQLNESFEIKALDGVIRAYEDQAEELVRAIHKVNAPEMQALRDIDDAYEAHFRKIDELRELDHISAQEWSARTAFIEQARLTEYYDTAARQEERLAEIRRRNEDSQRRQREVWLEAGARAFENLATAAKASGKRGFEAAKAFSTAKAIIDTYTAANGAYAALASIPYVGPALGAAAAAAAIAAGMANVRAIQAQKGQAHAGVDWVPQDQTVLLQQGERVIKRNQNERLMEMIDGGGTGGGGLYQVNIFLDGAVLARGLGQMSRDGRLTISAKGIV